MPSLEIRHLKVWDSRTGNILVSDSSFYVDQGKCLAIVGESGSGKSLTCKAIMRLNKVNLHQSGNIVLNGIHLEDLSEKEMRKFRGKHLCMIMQNGMRAFDPSRTIGAHLLKTLEIHCNWSRSDAIAKLQTAMSSVGLKEPDKVLSSYPYQLSGGMLQRTMITLAIVLEPEVVIADEPTTALDAITQYEVVEQFVQLRNRLGSMMIFVSHDLGIVKRIADDVLVMKDGQIVERGKTSDVMASAKHPYTQYLVSSKLALSRHLTELMGGEQIVEG